LGRDTRPFGFSNRWGYWRWHAPWVRYFVFGITILHEPRSQNGAGEKVLWRQSLTSPVLVLFAVGIVVGGLWCTTFLDRFALGLTLLASSVPMLWFSRIVVCADRFGLTVRYGPGWPSTRIGLDRISSAHSIDMQPMKWGGWGYRGSVRFFRRAAIVLRKGKGIRLDLTNGAVFAVTIDDAETGAQLLNSLVAQSSRG
jgi:hypothetical protein